MPESDTPSGTAELSVESGANAIAALLSPPEPDKEQAGPEAAGAAPDAKPSDQVSDDETQPETETPEPKIEQEPRYRLPDGTEVTPDQIEEWRKGNLRQADYTRKTQELSANRRELEARQAEIAQQSQRFQQTVDFAIAVAEANFPARPDAALLETDPVGYLQQKAVYDQRAAQLQQLYAARQEQGAEQARQQQQAFRQWAEGERRALAEAMPELRDPTKAMGFSAALVKGIERYGFTNADLAQVYDHRLILMARDAMKYHEVMAAKPKAIEKAKDAPPVQQPRARTSQVDAATRARKEKMDRLRQTGSLRDGAAVILDMIQD